MEKVGLQEKSGRRGDIQVFHTQINTWSCKQVPHAEKEQSTGDKKQTQDSQSSVCWTRGGEEGE